MNSQLLFEEFLLANLTAKSLQYLGTCINYQINKEITLCRELIFFLVENTVVMYPLSNIKIQ